ncbi:hypothetical protein HK101_006024 [Irineochytrium annulatum]|nr:hypothetical protein HK101_006024 [Irineochytrium annulatum]
MNEIAGGVLQTANWNETAKNYTNPASYLNIPWFFILSSSQFYTYMLTHPTMTDTWFSLAYLAGQQIGATSRMAFIPEVSTTHPAFSCSIGFETGTAFGQFFSNLQVSPNARTFMMNATDGLLIAASSAHSTFSSNDTLIYEAGKALLAAYGGSYSKIPNTGATVTFQTSWGGETWIISTKYLKNPKEWVLVIAVPRSDFFGNIDKANKNVLIIAICVSIGGIALTALVSFLSLRPLSVLVSAMGSLTKLDFTALEGLFDLSKEG